MSNVFDLKRIEKAIEPSPLLFSSTLPSTNTRGLELVKDGQPSPFLVICDHQTAGRGQQGRTWMTCRGSLTFSWCFEITPAKTPNGWGLLSLAAGLAVCETIEHFFPTLEPKIKWPNDILIDGKKVCGILVETATNDDGKLISVVGVGINLDDQDGSLERMVSERPVRFPAGAIGALASEDANGPSNVEGLYTDFLITLIDRLKRQFQTLKQRNMSKDVITSCQRRMWGRGRTMEIELPGGKTVVGSESCIDADGRLSLVIDGRKQAFFSASIVKVL